jgi:hypothetical protein
MRIVFCFIPCSNNFLNQIQESVGNNNIIGQNQLASGHYYLVFRINKNDFFCICQELNNRNQRIQVNKQLIRDIIIQCFPKKPMGEFNVWIFCQHTPSSKIETEIRGLQEGYVTPFINNRNRNLDNFLNGLGNPQPVNLNDPLIIIATPSGRVTKEWELACESEYSGKKLYKYQDSKINNSTNVNDANIIEFVINDFRVLFVKEDEYIKNDKNPTGIDNFLNAILEYNDWKKISEKYIAIHDLDSYVSNVSQFKNKVNFICDFHHTEEYKEFTDALIKFLDLINKNNTREAIKKCEEIKELIEKFSKQTIKNFSLLKHRIAHLFLPLDIDLQGIYEVGKQSKDAAVGYLRDVLENKCEKFYRRKLADLWFMVVKGKMEDGKWKIDNNEKEIKGGKLMVDNFGKEEFECIPVSPRNNPDELLADGKAIIDLIKEKKRDKEVEKFWKTLLKICGLHYDENEPFKKSEIYPQSSIFGLPNSSILEFMCYLDWLIKNRNTLSESEKQEAVSKATNFEELKKLVDSLSSILNLPSSGLPFHDWFVALNECLDKLRTAISKEEQG